MSRSIDITGREFASHYNTGKIECIDAIREALGPRGFADYCRGNVIKYLWRGPHKASEHGDMIKARDYLNWLIEELEQ
jgi:hypothetical protein